MSETIFLTGATGFIGSALSRLLLSKGYEVRVLTRPRNDRTNLDGLKVEIVEGDLTKPETYREALKGCKYLFHAAADYRIWVPDVAAMNRVNIGGTKMLMLAALEAGIEKIVYTSSVATLGHYPDGSPADEETPVSFKDMIGVYKQSKFLAEEEVLRLIRHYNLPAVIVNPSTPVGPRDIKPTPTGRIIVNAVNGLMPAYVDTGLNIVHVDDVAEGHWLACEKGKIGERYILGGTDLELSEILKTIAASTGHKPPKIKLPIPPLFPIAVLMEGFARIMESEPILTRDALRMAQRKMFFVSDKAQRELGYTFRPAYDALSDAIEWFRTEGYC